MKTKLDIFDFDGTLFKSPVDNAANREKYERATGLPWVIDKAKSRELTKQKGHFVGMRNGWFGREETLMPPLVPVPAPHNWFIHEICEQLEKSKTDPSIITVLMTGRHVGLRDHVLRICHDGKLFLIEKIQSKEKVYYKGVDPDVQLLCLGDDGPAPVGTKPSDTFGWKTWIIRQFLEVHVDLAKIEIWEDRDKHVEAFRALQSELPHEVIVNHVRAK